MPLTVLAFFLTPLWQKAGFSILAIVSFLISSSHVWKTERKKVENFEKDLTPRLELSFSDSIAGCVVYAPSRENPEYKCFRLKVMSNSSNRLTGCTGYLRSISSTRSNFSHQPVKLTFAPSEDPDTIQKNIDSGVEVFLDVLLIRRINLEIRLCTPNFRVPNDFDTSSFFEGNGKYLFEVYIASNEAVVQRCVLEFDWANNWAMANMRLIS